VKLESCNLNLIIRDILNWATEYLMSFHIPSARLDSEVLLSFILNKNRTYLYQNPKFQIPDSKFKRFRELIERRGKMEPISYITGEKEFWSLKFKVTRDTLIPRPDTEILVQTVIDVISNQLSVVSSQLNILDIGTGSGNIAVSIAKEVPNSHVFTVDKSEGALSVAKENAITHGVLEKITFVKGDLIPFSDLQYKNYFDIIVSNPPYIPTDDIDGLMPEVKDWEPRGALDGGKDGLEVIRKIIKDAPIFLKPAPAGLKQGSGRFLAMEIGFGQAGDVKNIIEETGKFSDIRFVKDLSGIDRVVTAWKR
jgi:release factor glutamine methyltransferase